MANHYLINTVLLVSHFFGSAQSQIQKDTFVVDHIYFNMVKKEIYYQNVFSTDLSIENLKEYFISNRIVTDPIEGSDFLIGKLAKLIQLNSSSTLSVITGVDGAEMIGSIRVDFKELKYRVTLENIGTLFIQNVTSGVGKQIITEVNRPSYWNESFDFVFDKKGVFKEKFIQNYQMRSSEFDSYFEIARHNNDW